MKKRSFINFCAFWAILLYPQFVFGQLTADRLHTVRTDTFWTPIEISGDGTTIVGYWRKDGDAELLGARWTKADDLEDLGSFPGDFTFNKETSFLDASANGAVLVGGSNRDGHRNALAWTNETGLVDLTATFSELTSSVHFVSDDGKIIAGSRNGSSVRLNWETGNVEVINDIVASGFSADGSVLVGNLGLVGSSVPYRWENGEATQLGFLPGGDFAAIQDLSADGSTAIGRARNANGGMEVVYWQAGNITAIGEETNKAIAVSGDGSIVLGTFDDGEYFLWKNGETTLFEDVLDADSCTSGWDVIEVRGMTDDGSTFVLRAGNPEGTFDWWRLTLSATAGKSPPECGCVEWSSATGGSFEEGDNWESTNPPPATACVAFDVGSTYNVDFSEDEETGSLFVGEDLVTFDLNTHTYALSTSLTDDGSGITAPSLAVADAGETGTLIISDGTLLVENGFVKIGDGGGNGKLVISQDGRLELPDGSGVWMELAGSSGSSGGLLVEAGGLLTTPFTKEIAKEAGTTASIEVKDAGSKWLGAVTTLGENGSAELIIREEGEVDLLSLKTAENSGAEATILVTGEGSLLRTTEGGALVIGSGGASTLRVEDKAQVIQGLGGNVQVGLSHGSVGQIEITESAQWTNAGLFQVGVAGLGEMTVDEQATLTFHSLEIGGEHPSAAADKQAGADVFNKVVVSGKDTKLIQKGDFDSWVGRRGNGLLEIKEEAHLEMEGNLVVGGPPQEGVSISELEGTLEVRGSGSFVFIEGSLALGDQFRGTGLITDGGAVQAHEVWVGLLEAGEEVKSFLTVDDGGVLTSRWLRVGGAPGELAVVNGGQVVSDSVYIGWEEDVLGEVVVAGPGAKLTAAELNVGLELTQGLLTVEAGGSVETSKMFVGPGGTVIGTAITIGGGANKQAEGIVTDSLLLATGARLEIETMAISEAAVLGYALGAGEEDHMEIGSELVLSGQLAVTIAPGYMPMVGEEFVMITADAITGQFASIKTQEGLEVELSYEPTAVKIKVLDYTLVQVGHEAEAALPETHRLLQNYPNPFNPQTNIGYELAEPGHVSLIVYDVLGREVERLVEAQQAAGRYEVLFEASALPSGIYFYGLRVQGPLQNVSVEGQRQMVLLR